MSTRILLVEDEATISEPLAENLGRDGFEAEVAPTLAGAREAFRREAPDLVFARRDASPMETAEISRGRSAGVRRPDRDAHGQGEEIDRVLGIELGADDYVVKPFSPAELVARVDAVLRRGDPEPEREAPIAFDDLEIDPAARIVLVRGEEVQLTVHEFDLLLYLVRHPGQAFSRDQLMDAIWEYTFYTDTSTVTVHMRRLRAKVELDPSEPRWLQTVWGVGYRFQP
jgi:DNA-binding response OmpR family regulator